MTRLQPIAVLLLLSGLASSAPAEDRPWRGPLPVREQFTPELIALDFTPRDASLLARGEWALEIGLVQANTFEISPRHDQRVEDFLAGKETPGYSFVMDAETSRAQVRVDFGLSRHVQLGLELPVLHHGGGFLDSLIDSTHDAFGLETNSREERPRDRLELDLIAGSGRYLRERSGTELGDAVLSAKIRLHDGDAHALALVLEAKAPTGDEASLAGSGSWDFGASLLGSAATGSGKHAWHWGLGWFVLGEPEQLPLDFEDTLNAFFGYEYRASAAWSVVAQVSAASAALPEQDGVPHGDPRAGLAVGFHRGGERWQLSAGFLQNLTTNDNTQDLGLFVLGSWRR